MTEISPKKVSHLQKFYKIINKKNYDIYEISKWLIPNINLIESYIDKKDYRKQYEYNTTLIYLLNLLDKNNKTGKNKDKINYFAIKNKLLLHKLKESKAKIGKPKIGSDDYYKQRLAAKRKWYKKNKKKTSDYNRKYYEKHIKINSEKQSKKHSIKHSKKRSSKKHSRKHNKKKG